MADFFTDLRKDFPITDRCVYLDHASGGPIPLPVQAAIDSYYKENREDADFAWMKWMARREEARECVARFLNAEPDEIAFIHGTSFGMNLVAELIASEGSVLTNTSEFPSSTLPWINRNIPILWQDSQQGEISLEKLKSLLTPNVKTILTSLVQYATGFRQDVSALGALKGDRYLVVNATQGFGNTPIDVKKWNVDFLITNSYKWAMAGYGGGVLYIKKEWLKKFKPQTVGWRSMLRPDAMDNQRIDLHPAASRYEMSCPSFPTIFGFGAATAYFEKIGIDKIQERVLELTRFAIEELKKTGRRVMTPEADEKRAGIVVFEEVQAELLWKKLLNEKIYVSPRGAGLRLAPHFYNTFEEIETFLKTLTRFSKK